MNVSNGVEINVYIFLYFFLDVSRVVIRHVIWGKNVDQNSTITKSLR